MERKNNWEVDSCKIPYSIEMFCDNLKYFSKLDFCKNCHAIFLVGIKKPPLSIRLGSYTG